MSDTNAQKPIAEVIDEERKTLIHRYPWEGEKIVAYAEGVVQLINNTIEESSGENAKSYLDEICKQLDFIEKNQLGGIPPEIQRYVTMSRSLVRKQILSGEIELSKIPVTPKKKPGSIEEALILAETEG